MLHANQFELCLDYAYYSDNISKQSKFYCENFVNFFNEYLRHSLRYTSKPL
jgi:hypothetical protein